jgi:hypothetical protein
MDDSVFGYIGYPTLTSIALAYSWISGRYDNDNKTSDLFRGCRGRVGIHPAQLWQGCLERIDNVYLKISTKSVYITCNQLDISSPDFCFDLPPKAISTKNRPVAYPSSGLSALF